MKLKGQGQTQFPCLKRRSIDALGGGENREEQRGQGRRSELHKSALQGRAPLERPNKTKGPPPSMNSKQVLLMGSRVWQRWWGGAVFNLVRSCERPTARALEWRSGGDEGQFACSLVSERSEREKRT